MKNPIILLFWLILLGGVLNYFITASNITNETRDQMRQAYVAYKRGETAATLGERREAFNKALQLYTGFEKKFQPAFGNGTLYYNIANSYFQLEQYPWSVLYYNRALKLAPRDEKTEHNLKVAREKLGLEQEKERNVFGKVFFFYTYLSLPERLQAFFTLSALALILFSMYIWKEKKWQRQLAALSAAFAAVMLLTLAYGHYIAPIDGVIIRSTALYRDAGRQYAKVVEDPILSGRKVEVLQVLAEGKWLKVMTPSGNLGYVPAESIRII